LTTLDFAVVAVYLAAIVAVGWWAGRRDARDGVEGFFLAGRKLPWWLLGTSMVATTLAADTPLTVVGLTLSKGVAANWFWWSFAVSHVLVSVGLARLWRRADVLTDAELCELRYRGRAAPVLRGLKAFYFAVPINCFVMGWVLLAMAKVSAAVLPELHPWLVVAVLLAVTVAYSLRSGFSAVVLTDLLQFPIALGGAVVLAWIAVDQAGGLPAVRAAAVAYKGEGMLALFPAGGELLPWHALAAFLGVQWWAQKNADGGGVLIQRLLAARDEREAERGGLWFCVAHYILRPWPWILAALAALVLVPDAVATDPEGAYAELIVRVLPSGLRGLLVAGFLAAFMSTMDTQLNWGASYIVNDLAGRFTALPPDRLPHVSRLAVAGMALLALVAGSAMDSIVGAWQLIVAFGAGSGAVVLLRWYWWRITAEAEIAAMLASTVLAAAVYRWAPDVAYVWQLLIIAGGSALVWLPVTLWACPAPAEVGPFYQRVRPPGPGWSAVAYSVSAPPPSSLLRDVVRWLGWLAVVLGGLLGLGWILLRP